MTEGLLTIIYNQHDTIDNTTVTLLTNNSESTMLSIESYRDFWAAYDSVLERYKKNGSRIVTAPIIDRDENNYFRVTTTIGKA